MHLRRAPGTKNSVDPSAPPTVSHDFSITRRGLRQAHEWRGRHVSVFIEFNEDGSACIATSRLVRSAIVRTFDAIYTKFVRITHFTPTGTQPLPIEIPLDNNGAGGLAHHGIGGISVGASLFQATVLRWEKAIKECNGNVEWLPGDDGMFSANRPEGASIDQVYLYELNRNFWAPWMNRKIDWVCDDDDSCWGWWTVGMNNAMAVVIPTVMRMPFFYFGHSIENFRWGMIGHLKQYHTNVCCDKNYHGDDNFMMGWTRSRMIWRNSASVNDLMTGLILRSFDQFGGERFMERLFLEFEKANDINRGTAGERNFQDARDNIFLMWSRAAMGNLADLFKCELAWRISEHAERKISAEYPVPAPAKFTLALDSIGR